ncbi:MAG: 50S ribosomal protein L14 [Candidatus Diapherotrites archaeon]|nr:50S ribosomal protein L14 [Candidatus Diapherotrites archaeon]
MQAVNAFPVRGLNQKTRLTCADNSGAKEVAIISVLKYKSRKRQSPKAGIGDLLNVVVKKGKPEIRKKVERAIVIRVKKEYRRSDGTRIKFEDNAVVLVDDKGGPKASEVKGVMAKEAAERWPKIAGLASQIV